MGNTESRVGISQYTGQKWNTWLTADSPKPLAQQIQISTLWLLNGKSVDHVPVSIGDLAVQRVNSVIYLGLGILDDLSWAKHIDVFMKDITTSNFLDV